MSSEIVFVGVATNKLLRNSVNDMYGNNIETKKNQP